MRFILLAFAFVSLVVNGQEAKPHSDTDKRHAATTSKDTTDAAAQTVIVINQQAPQGQQNDHPANPPSHLHEYLLPANVLTLALVLVGIGGIIAAVVSLRKIDRQITQMRRQVDLSFGQLRAMHEQIAEMSAQTEVFERSVAATKESAEAAKLSADIAAGVAIPTLKVEKFELRNMGNAGIVAILQLPNLNIVIRNYGQSPAFLHSWSIVLTCEELPDVPDYFGHPGSGNFLDKMVVQPNQPYTLPELPGRRRQSFSIEDIKAIISHEKMLSVYGYVCYGDIFGNPLKRLKFCEFALNIGDSWVEWCDMADPVYCGTDLYPIKGKGTTVEAEPADEQAN